MAKLNKISFGFNAVQAGQKTSVANVEPQLMVCSTVGKFTINPAVTKAMNISVGEHVMFINNINALESAIACKHPDVIDWADENGVDLTTIEGQEAFIKEATVWGIAKGIAMYDSKGNPLMASERYTNEDKLNFIQENGAEFLANDEFRAALIERVGNEDATDEELIAAITVKDVQTPKTPAFTGSKTSTTANTTGVGAQLSFTHAATWNALKADIEDKASKNRIFDVMVKEPFTTQVHNGKEYVDVVAYPIEFNSDVDPIRGKKN